MESESVSTLDRSFPDSQGHSKQAGMYEANKEDEWQGKLTSLQDQHKHESLQQQQEHLEQLRLLQTQLLRELSSDMSLEGGHSLQELWTSKQQSSVDIRELPTLKLEEETEDKREDSSSPKKEANTESQNVVSPAESLEFLQLPLPDNSLTHTSTIISVSPKESPAKTDSPYKSPLKQSPHGTPAYKILGSRSAWEGKTTSPSPQKPGPGWSIPRTPQSAVRGEVPSRASLLAKHAKHVEDLKGYYESELASLRRQLEQVKPGALVGSPLRGSGPSSPAKRQLKFTSGEAFSPAKERVSESELWILQSENGRLKSTCSELQGRLDETEREKHVLEGQLKRVQEHIFEWQERCESSEKLVSVLQERLDSTRTQLHDQERLNGQLTSDLKLTTEELVFWKDQKLQDVEKLDQLFHEFEVLQEENQRLLSMNSDLKAKLDESGGESVVLRSSLDKYQILESQYKSTIRRLEDEVRHLETINNRLHSQATHYDTGWHDDPGTTHHSHVTRTPQPDLSRHAHHYPQNSPGQISHAYTEKSPSKPTARSKPPSDKSPGLTLGTPQSQDSTSRPLTRKKWLETSIPGLLFGGETEADDQPPASTSNSRLPSRMSPGPHGVKPVKHSPRQNQEGHNDRENIPRGSERAPTRYDANEAGIDDTLSAIKQGTVVTGGEGKRKSKKKSEQSIEERVRLQMEMVGEAERRLAELQTEKERLESVLQRTPRPGGRVTREAKQSQLDVERRLEQVMREIGSVRMVLRKHHAFKR